MPENAIIRTPLRVTSVIAALDAGGIGPVCSYTAEGLARLTDWQVTLLSLHDSKKEIADGASGLRTVCLGLKSDCERAFLEWLDANPQDVIISGDVSRIEGAFPFLPVNTRHIVQIHDSLRRYREVAVRNHAWIDGVTCVGRHIEAPLRGSLAARGFHGLLQAIHNGAHFPPLKPRNSYAGPLRLLFMGRVEALKGVFDFVPILRELKKRRVPVTLRLVGGENKTLRREFERNGLIELVDWVGRVSHAECYAIASTSDLLMMPSRKEAFGMVTIEAMSMGCIPIAYDFPSGSREIIVHDQSGLLVRLGDYKAWASAIEALHFDRMRLSQLSAGAVKRARSCFDADTMAKNMAQFIDDVYRHAEGNPARRLEGVPQLESNKKAKAVFSYQRLPEGFRLWIRNKVCSSPRLCHWVLNR